MQMKRREWDIVEFMLCGEEEEEEAYSLEDLLSPDVLQARVEVLDALRDVLQLALVRALDLAGLADG